MLRVQIFNRSRSLKAPLIVDYCNSFICKLRGLAFRRQLPADRGLILVSSGESRLGAAIHMWGMFFNLTLVWLNTDLKVVDLQHGRRWRSLLIPRKPARYVIECGVSRYEEFQIDDQLAFEAKD